MRILFLTDNFPPESNAPATRTYEHAVRWARAGHEVSVITGAPNFPEGRVYPGYRNAWRQVEMVDGVRVVRVKTYITANEGLFRRTLDYLSFMVMAMVVGAFERRPSVVVATSPQFFTAVAGWLLSVRFWRPFVFELRDLWPASIAAVGAMRRSLVLRLMERLELFLYRRAALVVAVTGSFADDLAARGIPRSRVEVVLNGVDLARFSPQACDPDLERQLGLEGRFVVGYLGTHGMAHALPKVLEAAALLREREDIVFLFAGAGAERASIERMVREQGLENVRLLPRQPRERMAALWSACDLALVPLRDQPVFATVIPSKIFEAMAMGVPVLLSLPEGEAARIVRGAGSGICVPPEQPQAMAEAIVALAADPQRMAMLRAQALAAAPGHSRDAAADRMLALLEAAVRPAG